MHRKLNGDASSAKFMMKLDAVGSTTDLDGISHIDSFLEAGRDQGLTVLWAIKPNMEIGGTNKSSIHFSVRKQANSNVNFQLGDASRSIDMGRRALLDDSSVFRENSVTSRLNPIKSQQLNSRQSDLPIFLTEVAEESHTVKKHGVDAIQVKMIKTLNFSHIPPKSYSDSTSGPIRPGFFFFKWLAAGSSPPLLANIPETIIVDDIDVKYLYTNDRGQVVVENVDFDPDLRNKFVSSYLDKCIKKSVPLSQTTSSSGGHGELLADRVVAVIKRPTWKHFVSNRSEVLTPLPLLSCMLTAVDGLGGSQFMLQRFVKSKGRYPSFYRVLWRAAESGNTVSAWNISKKGAFESFQVASEISVHNEREKGESAEAASALNMTAFDPTDPEVSDRQLLQDLRQRRTLTTAERGLVDRISVAASKALSPNSLCSLTSDDGLITEEVSATLIASKVSGRAMKGVSEQMDRIATYMEATLFKRENCRVNLGELVCDFIRDDRDNWWFLQVKSFRIGQSSMPTLERWNSIKEHKRLAEAEDGALDAEVSIPIEVVPKNTVQIIKEMEERKGTKCKMCGLFFGHIHGDDRCVSMDDLEAIRSSLAVRKSKTDNEAFMSGASFLASLERPLGSKSQSQAYGGPAEEGAVGNKEATGNNSNNFEATKRQSLTATGIRRESLMVAVRRESEAARRESSANQTAVTTGARRRESTLRFEETTAESYSTSELASSKNSLGKGQEVNVAEEENLGLSGSDPLNKTSLLGKALTSGNFIADLGPGMERSFPLYGYRLSMRMACQLAELYRDATFSLTDFARDVLREYSDTADTTAISQLRGTDEFRLDASKKRSGAVSCCFFCFQIYEEHARYLHLIQRLLALLGVGPRPMRRKHDDRQSFATVMKAALVESHLRVDSNNKSVMAAKYREPEQLMITPSTMSSQSQWKVVNFPKNTKLWRVLIMAHYFIDVNVSSALLHGAVGSITYALGQTVNTLEFRFEKHNQDPMLWIQQCRTHFLFATKDDVRAVFSEKILDLHLFHCPRPPHSGSGGNTYFQPNAEINPRWEASFQVDLKSLRWKGLQDGSEKVDLLIPVPCKALGDSALLKLSVALCMDESIPPEASKEVFTREQDVFWPHPDFFVKAPLPNAWLHMLTDSRDFPAISSNEIGQEFDGLSGDPDLAPVIALVRGLFWKQRRTEDKTAECGSVIEILLTVLSMESEHRESNANSFDFDDEHEEREEEVVGTKADPFATVIRALRTIKEEVLPPRITWERFLKKLYTTIKFHQQSAVADTWRRRFSRRSAVFEEACMGDATEDPSVETLKKLTDRVIDLSNQYQGTPLDVNYHRRVGKRPRDSRDRAVNRALESISRSTNMLKTLHSTPLPSSVTRRSRRLLFLLSIFEEISRKEEMMDVSELRSYLLDQRAKLTQHVSLISGTSPWFTTVRCHYQTQVTEKFSLVRAVLCCHLWSRCEKFHEMFSQYEQQGYGVVSQVSFLTIAEECFREVNDGARSSSRLLDDDEVLESLVKASETIQTVSPNIRIRRAAKPQLIHSESDSSLGAGKDSDKINPLQTTKAYLQEGVPLLYLTCDLHGPGFFFMGDACCVRCEVAYHDEERREDAES